MVSLDDIDSQLAVYCPTTASFGAKTEQSVFVRSFVVLLQFVQPLIFLRCVT